MNRFGKKWGFSVGYRVEVKPHALEALKSLDKPVARVIRHWIFKNLEDTDNPRRTGKALKGTMSQFWRYRIGDYRLIVRIEDKVLTIFALEAGHRKTVYEKFKRYLNMK